MSDEVTFEYVKALKDDQNVLLIDVREPSELEKTGTIPGSINIPLGTLENALQNLSEEEFREKFGRDKPNTESAMVFSCHMGRRSQAALDLAKKLGYVNAKQYPGGWAGWDQGIKNLEVSLDYLKTLESNDSVLLIDVREPSELESTGTIPGSINIPLQTLESTLQNLSEEDFVSEFHKNKPTAETPLVFSCRSGRRSSMAVDVAKKLGYVDVKHYPGGWMGWEQAMKTQN